MSSIIPHSELTKQALAWICEQRELKTVAFNLTSAIEEACVRFSLGPMDAEFLTRFFKEQQEQERHC
jgi:hypothetical protein